MRTAIIDATGRVVNLITGEILPEQQEAFSQHFAKQYGQVWFLVVDDLHPVWIGGTYDDANGFTPPPEPEPLPEPEPELQEPV